MKCSWAYCGACPACKDPSLEMEPPRRKQAPKGQQLHADTDVCEDWCSGEAFEVVHQNTTTTKAFSWDMKCKWRYCDSCSECKGSESRLSLASEKGPFDVLGWLRHDEMESTEADAKQALKVAAKKKTASVDSSIAEEEARKSDANAEAASNLSGHMNHTETQRCDDWCDKEMFVKVEANSTVMKNLSSWGMKCSWAYCGGCSVCSDPSLEMEPPRRKQAPKGQQLHVDKDVCEDWCSGEEFEVVHQNTTTTTAFSWDMKCKWRYCDSCSECKGSKSHLSLASEDGPFDVLGWFRHDEMESTEAGAKQALKVAAKKKTSSVVSSSADKIDASADSKDDSSGSDAKVASKVSGHVKHYKIQRCDDWCEKE